MISALRLSGRHMRGSTAGCVAVVIVLILIGAGAYIFYFREHGFTNAGGALHTVSNTTDSQKKDYLKEMKSLSAGVYSIRDMLGSFIAGVKKGEYKTQVDINKKAMDIENRMEETLSSLKKLSVPTEFSEGQKGIMDGLSSYYKCLKGLRRLNSSAIAGNIDMIDTALKQIQDDYGQGSSQITGGAEKISKKRKELKL